MRRAVWLCLVLGVGGGRLPGAESEITFEEHVRPILKAHCFGCHGEEPELSGGLDLRLVRLIRQGGDSGPAIASDKDDSHLLLERITAGEMPPKKQQPLTGPQRDVIARWLALGAPTKSPEPTSSDGLLISAEDRAFWSFQPLRDVAVPVVADSTWPNTPIDRFILAALESRGAAPSELASPRTRLRRLSYALRGLPPSWEDVQAFEQSPTVERYAALVQEWLASPQFGERWARVWLDLVRYVDQTPDYLNSADRAWLYRDWVVASFNQDRPYDDFLRLQLAADQLPESPPPDLAALGFLGLSPTYWKELRLAPDVIKTVVAEEWDERIDMVTRTVLGLTVSCARCHHHKYDPVTTDDYYALAGVFASTQLTERPLLPPQDAAVVMAARNRSAELTTRLKTITEANSAEAVAIQAQIDELASTTPHYHEPWAHVVEDASLYVLPKGEDETQLDIRRGKAQDLPIFRRGNPSNPGNIVQRRFLSVLSRGEPVRFTQGSGRLELANSLLHEARGLTARVFVNRVWAALFGRGIVRTPSDFGRQGEPPTHPELLEYLANRFVEEGWSVKRLVREIVLSAVFQQSGAPRADLDVIDPENRLLGRMPRVRLDVELWRDSMLAISGTLDTRLGGVAQSLEDENFHRRTLYGCVAREELHVLLRLFDFPEASSHSPQREPTTTPLQQLFVLNGPLLRSQSVALLASLGEASTSQRIDEAYRRIYQRLPTESERALGEAFLRRLSGDGPVTAEAWSAFLQVLLGLNELLFLD